MATPIADSPAPALPTLDTLGVTLPADVDAQAIATEWLRAFSQHSSSGDIPGILSLFVEDGWWRDMLAFTWDFRTFHGAANIKKFLQDRLTSTKPSASTLTEARLQKPFPDLAWVLVLFDFETDVGLANAVLRLVPQQGGAWKAFALTTNLSGLKAFPENIGPRRNPLPNHGKWLAQRAQEAVFRDADPQVVVVGAGQCGLQIAARLKSLGIPTLNVEKLPRIGDSWRNRYDALCLHDPVWYDHLPYLPFPPSWPVYTPAQKLANWLEFYADALELNVWTSSTVLKAEQRPDETWTVTVRRPDGTERTMHVQHVVLALGWGGAPRWPNIPGQDEFAGDVLHSSMHKSAKAFAGKKVVIVGACTSAHDIADECLEYGADVTMVQRDATCVMSVDKGLTASLGPLYTEGSTVPTDIADRLSNSLPLGVMKFFWQRFTAALGEIDKPTLDGLAKAGFKTTRGPEDLGLTYLALTRAGGYYLDVGTSQRIIEGRIKVKSDSRIARLAPAGPVFEDGSALPADVVIYATGFEPPRAMVADICGEAVAARVGPLWGFNAEGEQRRAWRDLGVPRLWYMIGNFAWARYYSQHLALQIAAQLGGQFGTRYSE